MTGDRAIASRPRFLGPLTAFHLSPIHHLARIMDNGHKVNGKPGHRVNDDRAQRTPAMQLELRMTKALNARAKYAIRAKAQGRAILHCIKLERS